MFDPKIMTFTFYLTIDQVGPRYMTSYETFPNIILGAFDRAILQTQAIPQIEKVRKRIELIFCIMIIRFRMLWKIFSGVEKC